MFNKNEFENWCRKLKLSKSAIEIISRVRESEPSRQVGGGRENVVGAYPSIKMGKCIHFESHKVELPGVYLKEHDDNVIEYYDQPPQIKISYKSRKGKVVAIYHTPDYFVFYEDKAGWEEWKTEEELCKLAVDSPNRFVKINGEWHCPPGEEYAKQFGLHYWIKSSNEINWQLQRNILFIEDYLIDNKTNLLPKMVETISSCVRSNPGILLLELLRTPGVEADDIYYMIAREIIFVDIKEELLSEPEYTQVFIDKQSALAYKTLTSHKNIPKFADHTLEVAPGVKVIWDGKPWTIANLGEKNISLLADEGIVQIPKEQFFNLACQGQIRGVENEIIKAIEATINSKLAEASEQELEIALNRYRIILPVLEGSKLDDIDITGAGVTLRTIRNWINSYIRAEQQYGSGFIGLIPSIKKRGNRISHLPDISLKAINDFLDANETVTNQSNKVLYGKFFNNCDISGVMIPSMKTFNKIIRSRSKYLRTLKTEGSRAAYQQDIFYWELEMTTPRHGDRPFEIAHIDHTLIDLQLIHSKTGKNFEKAWLSILMDAHNRRVLSFYVSFDAPSYRSDMMLLRECVRRFNRLPQTIIMDNGRDFKSIYFESFLSYYRVTYKYRPSHKARFGSVLERLFGTTMSQIIHNLQGNTKIMRNVRQVTKSVNPANYAVWTLPALYELLKEYFYEFYDTHIHSTLGESPREAFEREIAVTGKRPVRFIAYNEEFRIMTLPAIKYNNGTAIVDPQRGVKANYFYYYNEEFFKPNVAGTRVKVRYDPWNMGIVHCYVNGGWIKCYSQYYHVLSGKSENEIKIASQELLKLKQQTAKGWKISAKQLADFISKAEQTEELLKQRYRDDEMTQQLYVINGYNDTIPNQANHANCKPDFDLDEELNFDIDDE